MASELREYQFTIPVGTLATAPASMDLTMPPRVVEWITILVPPGPNGVMGFRIMNSNVQLIPYNPGAWIISNDEVINWQLENQITSGSWQVTGYNTGLFPHTIYIRFGVDPPPQPGSSSPTASLSLTALSASPDTVVTPELPIDLSAFSDPED